MSGTAGRKRTPPRTKDTDYSRSREAVAELAAKSRKKRKIGSAAMDRFLRFLWLFAANTTAQFPFSAATAQKSIDKSDVFLDDAEIGFDSVLIAAATAMFSLVLITIGMTMGATGLALIFAHAMTDEITKDRPRWVFFIPSSLDPFFYSALGRAVVKHGWATMILVVGLACCAIGFMSSRGD